MINTSSMRAVIKRMYTDRVTVKRYAESISTIGRTSITEAPVYNNIPCRLSKKTQSGNMQMEPSNNLNETAMLYVDTEYVIKQGDELHVTRGNRSYHYQAGEPFVYESHQEIVVSRKDYA